MLINFAFHLCWSTFHLCWSTFHLCVDQLFIFVDQLFICVLINFSSVLINFSSVCDQLCFSSVSVCDQLSLVNLPPISPSSSNENCPANKTDASAALEILERVGFYIFWLFHLASLILPFASSHLRVVGQKWGVERFEEGNLGEGLKEFKPGRLWEEEEEERENHCRSRDHLRGELKQRQDDKYFYLEYTLPVGEDVPGKVEPGKVLPGK